MKKWYLLVASIVGLSSPLQAQQDACAYYDGAVVINSDDEYIGRVTSSYASDSVFNEYGHYGSEYQSASIWNEYGKNGNEYRANSAFNEYSKNPPRLIKNRAIIGYLTVNKSISGAVNPIVLGITCYDFKPPR